jgi:spermidine synthase
MLKKTLSPEEKISSEKEGDYEFSVTKRGNTKVFKFNGIVHSELRDNSVYTDTYHDYFIPLPLLFDRPKVLLIGLGGGTIPFQLKSLYGDRVQIEAVEFSRGVIRIAKEFIPKGIRFKTVYGDGFEYMKRWKNRYDIIICDAFIANRIPKQFLGKEFVDAANRALTKNGILAVNYAPDIIFLPAYLLKLRKYFKVYTLKYILFANYILICSKHFDKSKIKSVVEKKIRKNKETEFLINAYRSM